MFAVLTSMAFACPPSSPDGYIDHIEMPDGCLHGTTTDPEMFNTPRTRVTFTNTCELPGTLTGGEGCDGCEVDVEIAPNEDVWIHLNTVPEDEIVDVSFSFTVPGSQPELVTVTVVGPIINVCEGYQRCSSVGAASSWLVLLLLPWLRRR